MKKLLFAVAAVGFILVLQPADPVQADKGDKTIICHLTDGLSGHVIEVSDNAVAAHCRHGLGDHNPTQEKRAGDFCSNPSQAPIRCQKGCFADDSSDCRF